MLEVGIGGVILIVLYIVFIKKSNKFVDKLALVMSNENYKPYLKSDFTDAEIEFFLFIRNEYLSHTFKTENLKEEVFIFLPSVWKHKNEDKFEIIVEINDNYLDSKALKDKVKSSFFKGHTDIVSIEELREKMENNLENKAEEYNIEITDIQLKYNHPYPIIISYSKLENKQLDKTERALKTLPKLLSINNNKQKYSKLISYDANKNEAIYSVIPGIENYKTWIGNKPKIIDTLNQNVEIEFDSYENIIKMYLVENLPKYITDIDIVDNKLQKGKIYYGESVYGSVYVDIADTKHQIIGGQSGSGKSVFTNGLLLSILYNLDTIDKIYMVDLKGGVELFGYEVLSDKIEVVYKKEDLLEVVKKLELEMNARLEYMRENGIKNIKELPIFLIFDEFAQVMNMGKDAFKEQNEILASLTSLSQLARATNIKLWVSLQKATTDNIESSFKANLQNRILMKVKDHFTKDLINEEQLKEIGVDPELFHEGRLIFYDDASGKAHLIQFPLVDEDDYKRLTISDKTINKELSEEFNTYKPKVIRDKMKKKSKAFTDMDLLAEVEGKTVEDLEAEMDESTIETIEGKEDKIERMFNDFDKEMTKRKAKTIREDKKIKSQLEDQKQELLSSSGEPLNSIKNGDFDDILDIDELKLDTVEEDIEVIETIEDIPLNDTEFKNIEDNLDKFSNVEVQDKIEYLEDEKKSVEDEKGEPLSSFLVKHIDDTEVL